VPTHDVVNAVLNRHLVARGTSRHVGPPHQAMRLP
jgi:hypothetical protein